MEVIYKLLIISKKIISFLNEKLYFYNIFIRFRLMFEATPPKEDDQILI